MSRVRMVNPRTFLQLCASGVPVDADAIMREIRCGRPLALAIIQRSAALERCMVKAPAVAKQFAKYGNPPRQLVCAAAVAPLRTGRDFDSNIIRKLAFSVMNG